MFLNEYSVELALICCLFEVCNINIYKDKSFVTVLLKILVSGVCGIKSKATAGPIGGHNYSFFDLQAYRTKIGRKHYTLDQKSLWDLFLTR